MGINSLYLEKVTNYRVMIKKHHLNPLLSRAKWNIFLGKNILRLKGNNLKFKCENMHTRIIR